MNKEFYPTPKCLLDKILQGIKWKQINNILEPSAGKGDITEYVIEKLNQNKSSDYFTVDCIENDPELQACLKGKNLTLISDDFLKFSTYKKYDMIIMNPPFSNGDLHLLKALEIQKKGGDVICILNAETIRNPYSNSRKELIQKLENFQAQIEFMENEFMQAERTSNVEIAVIKVHIPQKELHSCFIEELQQKQTYHEIDDIELNALSVNDYIEAIIQQCNLEMAAGIRLIEEYMGMKPYIMNRVGCEGYIKPIIDLKINGSSDCKNPVNCFVKAIRFKYWTALFNNPKFTNGMTSNLREQYLSNISKLDNYDFSYYNIKTIQEDMSKSLIKGVEDCIIELFDTFSYQYSYSDELSKNIHYYNGWKTNKAWIINKKIIVPFMNAWNYLNDYDPTRYEIESKLFDIEQALNYLDGGLTTPINMHDSLCQARRSDSTKKIPLKYFTVSFYKKGTCHIEFTNLDLLKKLNIYGSQKKGWLPPAYGKKSYSELTLTEKHVVDDFEGEKSYKETISNAEYFIYNPSNMTLLDTVEHS